jgi:nucleoside-diphosphate-sugar epimerase
MQIVVIGGAGVLGQALLRAIVARGAMTRSDGTTAPVGRLISVDRHQPPRPFVESRLEYVRADGHAVLVGERRHRFSGDPAGRPAGLRPAAAALVRDVPADLGHPRLLSAVMGTVTDSVYHAWDATDLAADIGGATPDAMAPTFALIDSLRDLLRNCASQAVTPKVVLASTYAAMGPHSPGSALGDSDPLADGGEGLRLRVAELLLAGACGLGRIDGRALRLPSIAAAPGLGSFIGSWLVSLCQGVAAECPVPRDAKLYLATADLAAQALVHAHELPAAAWAEVDALHAPAQATSIDQLVAAAGRCAGRAVAAPVFRTDPAARTPPQPSARAFEQALQLGFAPGPDADALVAELLKPAAR